MARRTSRSSRSRPAATSICWPSKRWPGGRSSSPSPTPRASARSATPWPARASRRAPDRRRLSRRPRWAPIGSCPPSSAPRGSARPSPLPGAAQSWRSPTRRAWSAPARRCSTQRAGRRRDHPGRPGALGDLPGVRLRASGPGRAADDHRSGGPFRDWGRTAMARATPEQAVAHPNFRMGAKISVDSATMMNKGLEMIEASYLFAMPPDRIEVLIHPEQVIHSLVEVASSGGTASTLAQLGFDMRTPIACAFAWPVRPLYWTWRRSARSPSPRRILSVSRRSRSLVRR